ncbi:hypothetical protein ACFYS8_00950 [Kitasatospora sp. NPDC004615]|uniref:hypothetical protein n=1 Tax=unclassified Kitasatospora TaxID=2633591 RepID=UPI0036A94229
MDSLRVMAMRQVAGRLWPEHLPMAAAELLAEGHDSPALRELAGWSGGERSAELVQLWYLVLDELGVERLELAEAERWALRDAAARLVSGEIVSLPDLVGEVTGLDIDNAEEGPELRFSIAVREGCCQWCVEDLIAVGEPELLAAWETKVRAAAAALVAEAR